MTILIKNIFTISMVILLIVIMLGFVRNEYVYRTYKKILKGVNDYLADVRSKRHVTASEIRATFYMVHAEATYDEMFVRFWVFWWKRFVPKELAEKIEPYM